MSERDWQADLALCEQATAGPWEVDYRGATGHVKSTASADESRTPTVLLYRTDTMSIAWEQKQLNGQFAAAARTGWPAAIRRVLHLERMIARDAVTPCACCGAKLSWEFSGDGTTAIEVDTGTEHKCQHDMETAPDGTYRAVERERNELRKRVEQLEERDREWYLAARKALADQLATGLETQELVADTADLYELCRGRGWSDTPEPVVKQMCEQRDAAEKRVLELEAERDQLRESIETAWTVLSEMPPPHDYRVEAVIAGLWEQMEKWGRTNG